MSFWVYILRCADGSYYTGHTDNLEKRIAEHHTGAFANCYTFNRRPLELVFFQEFSTRAEALVCERQIKGWRRKKKEAMIRGDWAEVSRLAHTSKSPVRPEPVEGRPVEGHPVEGKSPVRPELVEGSLVEVHPPVRPELVEGSLVEGSLVEGSLVEGSLVEGQLSFVHPEPVEGYPVEKPHGSTVRSARCSPRTEKALL